MNQPNRDLRHADESVRLAARSSDRDPAASARGGIRGGARDGISAPSRRNGEPGFTAASRWPHRLAIALCWVTFPLVWVGGLVTTYNAGMAVPDWPTTYGHNLFLYPWQTWLFGPWDLFIEHGHRLLGALAGILTIAFVVSVFRYDGRTWLRITACAALVAVILQGCLGGARVLLDERQLAMLHGCAGPAFFAFCVALAVFTSRLWKYSSPPAEHASAGGVHRLALLTGLVAYVQLVIGAQLRHMSVMASPNVFRVTLIFHLLMALVLAAHVLLLAWTIWRHHRESTALRRPALWLGLLIGLQLVLGPASWVVKYGWPSWLAAYHFAAAHTVQANSLIQTTIVTSHVATGSLVLGIAVLVSLRSFRLVRAEAVALGSGALLVGMAT